MTRIEQLQHWCAACLNLSAPQIKLSSVSGDASFRRYFRFTVGDQTYIAVDAPPDKEKNPQFVAVSKALSAAEIIVPQVHFSEFTQGFLLLSDLGDQLLLPQLNLQSAPAFYSEAFQILLKLQNINESDIEIELEQYDAAFFRREMQLFNEWFIEKLLGLTLDAQEQKLLQECYQTLIDNATSQPYALVHRDFHSRNLLIQAKQKLGVLDFQDAVWGPITYDSVSLLKDCYIKWPTTELDHWLSEYFNLLRQGPHFPDVGLEQFRRWHTLMGMQRHFKVVGIFCRLWIRDRKNTYLQDLPRVLNYLLEASAEFPEFAQLATWLEQKILPLYFKRASHDAT